MLTCTGTVKFQHLLQCSSRTSLHWRVAVVCWQKFPLLAWDFLGWKPTMHDIADSVPGHVVVRMSKQQRRDVVERMGAMQYFSRTWNVLVADVPVTCTRPHQLDVRVVGGSRNQMVCFVGGPNPLIQPSKALAALRCSVRLPPRSQWPEPG